MSGTAGYDAIIFDLDGTLTDPKVGITKSVQYALAQLSIIEDDLNRLTPFIGPPLVESFQRYYELDAATARRAVGCYRDYFSSTGLYENCVYPGIPALLRQLHDDGKTLAVATSKATIFAERILAHFGLALYFQGIVGSNLDHTHETKTEVIAHLLREYPTFRERPTIMVGDREHDVIGARDNAVETIAVSYGYGSLAELEAARPERIVHSVAELGTLLREAES